MSPGESPSKKNPSGAAKVRESPGWTGQTVHFHRMAHPTHTQLTFAGQPAPSTGAGIYTLECELPQVFPSSFAAGILMYRVVESD